MNNTKNIFKVTNSLEEVRRNPGELSHVQLQRLLAEGRRLHSNYVTGLLIGVWRRFRRAGAWLYAQIGARRGKSGRTQRRGDGCKRQPILSRPSGSAGHHCFS